ncbi:serine/threonine protein kinase [Rhabdothermincola salaria]|uniref:serine/threonine protein kinase n=1 Tax=Rhabdothermincola salaria TaxID=2903142 RepID=UPI001E3EC552|nr:protein kinase [Rhabdothermincola salaria]MCD9624213.1 protein kinase [Rhabdothermincola salaria]
MACFDLDDGSVVTIWPAPDATPLSLHLAAADDVLDAEEAERLAADIADALAHVHAKGMGHGSVSSATAQVLADGHGALRLGHAISDDPGVVMADGGALADLFDQLAEASTTKSLADLAAELRAGTLSCAQAREALVGAAPAPAGPAEVLPSVWDLYTLAGPLTDEPAHTFLARDEGGDVVVKLLEGFDEEDPETWNEYRVLRGLNHECIVRAIGAGVAAEGPYLVTTYLDGPSLREAIDAGLVRSTDRVLSTVLELLGALDVMHPDPNARRQLTSLERSETDMATFRSLRDSSEKGVVHNDIRPENVRLVGGRRPILFDFDLAARPGALVGVVASPYRPEDLPAGEVAVDADLYAVGVMLHELLTGKQPFRTDGAGRRVLAVDESLPPEIASVIRQACAPRQHQRFRTASEFSEALVAAGVGGGLGIEVEPGAAELLSRIDRLWRDKDFDAALDLCPADWDRLRDRLETARDAAARPVDLVLAIEGVELHRVGERLIGPGQTAGASPFEEAVASVYRAVLPDGGYVDFAYACSDDAGEAWIQGLDTLHVPSRLTRLAQGLRASEQEGPDPNAVYLRLRQARLTPDRGPDWSNVFKASLSELDAGAGCDVAAVLMSAGAKAVDSQAVAIGDTGRTRGESCVVYDPDEPGDVPALAYFLTRVIPLYRCVSN